MQEVEMQEVEMLEAGMCIEEAERSVIVKSLTLL